MGDTLRVLPVLGTDGNRIVKNGKILVQNQSDKALMYVPAEYFINNSTNAPVINDQDNIVLEDDQDISYEEFNAEQNNEDANDSDDGCAKFSWSHRATKSFLQLYLDNRRLVYNRQLKNWKALWSKISEDMISIGFNVDPVQVENKYKSLKRSYKDMVQHNEKVGVEPKHIEFESELEKIFSKKHFKENRQYRIRNKPSNYSSKNQTTILNVQEQDQNNLEQVTEEHIIELTEGTMERPEFTWSSSATKLFLELYSTNRDLFQSRQIKSLKAMWNKISREMNDAGYDVYPMQVKMKYKSLKRSYKDMIRHNKKSRVEPIHIEFEDELKSLFAKKQRVICPIISGAKGIRIQTSHLGEEQFIPLGEPPITLLSDMNEEEDDNSVKFSSSTLKDTNVNGITEANFVSPNIGGAEPNKFEDRISATEESSLANNPRKRKRDEASSTVLQEALNIFRDSTKRKDTFQSEIEELYKMEVQNAQNFRRKSLHIKNRKLILLARLLQMQCERTSS